MALLGDSTEILQVFDPWEVLMLLSPEPQGSSRYNKVFCVWR